MKLIDLVSVFLESNENGGSCTRWFKIIVFEYYAMTTWRGQIDD